MKKTLPFLLLLFCKISFAQYNLVPNPSFEVFDTCPNWVAQINHAMFWTNPSNSTPDYFNACDTAGMHYAGVPANYAGYESAHSGVAYVAIGTYRNDAPHLHLNNYREYVETQLIDSLITGVDYCIRFYVSACDSSGFVSNNIGIYFSSTYIQYLCPSYPCTLPFNPQFENPSTNNLNSRNGWTEISGTYTATGGEKYIIIGNYKDSTTTIATSTGWTSWNNFAVYYIDDVLITPCDSLTGIEKIKVPLSINIFPNPFQNFFTVESKEQIIKEINVTDALGRIVFENKYIETKKTDINLVTQPFCFYYLKVITDKSNYHFKLIKNKTN
jgi:hypothetical protein